jgi:hypothetical protein
MVPAASKSMGPALENGYMDIDIHNVGPIVTVK